MRGICEVSLRPFASLYFMILSQSLHTLGYLDSTPLVLLGYSFGTYVSYDCARYLQDVYSYRIAHVISVAGIPLSVLSDSLTFKEAAGDTDVEKLKSVFQDMHGHIPPYFYSNGIHKLATPIIEGLLLIYRDLLNLQLYRYLLFSVMD